MTNSQLFANVSAYPKGAYYEEEIRQFQGIPSIAVTPKGRIFLCFESGGDHEPDPRQYSIVHYSDDGGKTWSEPVFVVECDRSKNIWIGDLQLWTAPNGDLHLYWAQEDMVGFEEEALKQYIMTPKFGDSRTTWQVICPNPDSDKLEFTEPKCLFNGCVRNRPIVLDTGRILYPAYDETHKEFHYVYSDDKGKTFVEKFGSKKVETDGDESMFWTKKDGTVVYFQRARTGFIGQAFSKDNGDTWTDAENSQIVHCASRFCIDRLPSGNLLLIGNDCYNQRIKMTCYLSEDDGKTWIKKVLDKRWETSYPEFTFYGDRIYATWDRERVRAKEILFASFTEEDLKNPDYEFHIQIVSKGKYKNPFVDIFYPDWYVPEEYKIEE